MTVSRYYLLMVCKLESHMKLAKFQFVFDFDSFSGVENIGQLSKHFVECLREKKKTRFQIAKLNFLLQNSI